MGEVGSSISDPKRTEEVTNRDSRHQISHNFRGTHDLISIKSNSTRQGDVYEIQATESSDDTLNCLPIVIAAVPAQATFPGKNGRIAFVQTREVFTMKPDGSDIKQRTHLGPDNSANWPAWSADGCRA